MLNTTALIVDDEPDICTLVRMTLEKMSITSDSVLNLREAKKKLSGKHFDVCLTDLRLPDGDGLELIDFIQEHCPEIPVAVITAHGNMEIAIKALKAGAFDFIPKPINIDVLRDLIRSAIRIKNLSQSSTTKTLIGDSSAMETLRQQIHKVARSQAPVYISGPSGSGKELVASIIHNSSSRQAGPFVPVNCGAIPQELMESEFFGHVKGSFTGAIQNKTGFFEAANHGTLFLDEIAELPLPMQVKLLRAIQEKKIRPVGSTDEKSVDVRILSATHKDLFALVRQNAFREDLFYRINVIEIGVPPLSERMEDLPELIEHILHKTSRNANGKTIPLSDEALNALKAYDFPGNVRELENILERAYTLCNHQTIRATDLQLPHHEKQIASQSRDKPLDDYLSDIEKDAIIKALEKANGNKTKAAELLGISFRTLRYRLKKLGLEHED